MLVAWMGHADGVDVSCWWLGCVMFVAWVNHIGCLDVSCHSISYHTISYHHITISYHITSDQIMSCHTISYVSHNISYHIILYYIMLVAWMVHVFIRSFRWGETYFPDLFLEVMLVAWMNNVGGLGVSCWLLG